MLTVLAAEPGDRYGFARDVAAKINGNTLEAEVKIEITGNSPEKRARFKYDSFCRRCPGGGIQFIGEGWTPIFYD